MPPPIVGIGASAGGLEALREFLRAVPRDSGAAYIVVQHLDPQQPAMLAALLRRASTLPVLEATDGTPVRPDHVYVIPPNAVLTVTAGSIRLAPRGPVLGLHTPIDALLTSLAQDQGPRATGAVLSGMGSDGTLGLEAIRARGGLTLAQTPESALFGSMSGHAIAAGCVDHVALPADMPKHIAAHVQAWRDSAAPDEAHEQAALLADPLQTILRILRDRGHHDFSLHKPGTLQRRIQRRMGVYGVGTMAEYAELLRQNVQESEILAKELLIGVTAFFRDASVWQAVGEHVLPRILRAQPDGYRMRAWVAGCSTGEEAYSLAMAVLETAAALPGRSLCTAQIFATDLSRDAIQIARRGVYPRSIADEVSAQRLTQFFVPFDSGYRVSSRVREMIVFAEHDVAVDPPFTRLDLLSCRNVLIYMKSALQKRLLKLFHHSLRPGGMLLLGNSETIGAQGGELFTVADPKHHCYERRDGGPPVQVPEFTIRPLSSPLTRRSQKEAPMSDADESKTALQALAEQVLLQQLSPPAVLVNQQGDIVYINGHTGRYLEPAAGKANWNVHVMAREGIRGALSNALSQAFVKASAVDVGGLVVDNDGQKHGVDITVQPLHGPKALEGMAMVVFRAVAPAKPRRRRGGSTTAQALDSELQQAHEEIKALHEEMRASQEELQASNEELQSTNEELLSTNEELTSSQEELQSMNEELQSVNDELQHKVDDLALAQSDMKNLLNSIDIAVLFLDNDLNVRRFNERMRQFISLRETDVGRPLKELSSVLDYADLLEDVRRVLRTLVFTETAVQSRDGRRYSVRIMPYRTQENVIQGAVITFVDVTATRHIEARPLAADPSSAADR